MLVSDWETNVKNGGEHWRTVPLRTPFINGKSWYVALGGAIAISTATRKGDSWHDHGSCNSVFRKSDGLPPMATRPPAVGRDARSMPRTVFLIRFENLLSFLKSMN